MIIKKLVLSSLFTAAGLFIAQADAPPGTVDIVWRSDNGDYGYMDGTNGWARIGGELYGPFMDGVPLKENITPGGHYIYVIPNRYEGEVDDESQLWPEVCIDGVWYCFEAFEYYAVRINDVGEWSVAYSEYYNGSLWIRSSSGNDMNFSWEGQFSIY